MDDIRIQFGTLLNVFGKAATHDGFWFAPAALKLEGNGFSTDYYLRDSVDEDRPEILKREYDASWVRARLPRVFGFTPELPEIEKSLLHEGFIAVPPGSPVGFPFVCADYYGRTGLMFSPAGPDQTMQSQIAAAFWSLLYEDPEDLADFETAVYHPGEGISMHYGCENGQLSYHESRDEDGDAGGDGDGDGGGDGE